MGLYLHGALSLPGGPFTTIWGPFTLVRPLVEGLGAGMRWLGPSPYPKSFQSVALVLTIKRKYTKNKTEWYSQGTITLYDHCQLLFLHLTV